MLSELEIELVDAVKASALAAYLREVGAMPTLDAKALLAKFAATAPAVYAVAGKVAFADATATARFGLLCIARNARGNDAARRGDGQTIGLYQILDGLAAWLDSHATDSTVWNVAAMDFPDGQIWRDNGLSAGILQLGAKVLPPKLLDETALGAFETFHADYDVDPFQAQGEHEKWAKEPPDYTTSLPELTDTTILPQ